MHHRRMFYNVAVTSSYVITAPIIALDESRFKDLIWKSCATVISETPSLAVIPDDETAVYPSLVRLPEIDLERCVIFEENISVRSSPCGNANNTLELDKFLQRQHNMSFSTDAPWWKLFILNARLKKDAIDFSACFIYSHSIGDGMSGVAFHAKFSEAITIHFLLHAPPIDSKVLTSSKPLLPPQEGLNPFPVSILFILKTLINEFWPSKPDPTLWAGNVIKMPLISRYRSIRIPKDNTTNILALCKSHGVTITVFLQELVAKSLFRLLPEKYTVLRSVIAVSTRRWMNGAVRDDDMGLFVTALLKMHHRASVSDTLQVDWEQILQSKLELQRFIDTNGKNIFTGLFFLLKNWHKYLQAQVGKNRSLSFEISNLGTPHRLDRAKNENVKVHSGEMLFSQTISVIDSAIEISAVTGGDGCLAMGFSWQEGVVEEEIIVHLSRDIEKYLRGQRD